MDVMKRQRGRGRKPGGNGGGGGGGSNQGNRPFESNGPDNVKIRGSASQIYEKYMQYSRDAQSSGDRVKSENMLQHAEHYFRILSATMPREQRMQQHDNAQYGRDEERDEELAADGSRSDDNMSDDGDDEGEADKVEVRHEPRNENRGNESRGNESRGAEARADDAQGDDDGEEQAEGSGEDRGRSRRRGRRRRPDGERAPAAAEVRAERPERAPVSEDREARSALDALAHKQAAVAGN